MPIRIKIGDIFEVVIDDRNKGHFQYIANDSTMLNSSVIRVFKEKYELEERIIPEDIVKDNIDFYAHVFLRNGIKLGHWKKIGHVPDLGNIEILFRDSDDYGKPQIRLSERWHVWQVNKPFVDVGKLEGQNQNAEIGVVIPSDSIVHRMRTGNYDFVYPGF